MNDVGILMGSDSDLPIMREAAELLELAGISFEVAIISGHRTPRQMVEYAESAAGRGLKVIIAGAGGAAHLPGMTAAFTPLPVIGVPIRTASFGGQDSLLSIVQMPAGVPVATMAVNGARNAGLFAARIIGVSDARVRAWVEAYAVRQTEEVLAKARRLGEKGWKDYEPGR
jgi:5-(carboxyamino)imidazole ribonucleotide mutase